MDIFSPSSTISLPKEWINIQQIISVRREFKYQDGLQSCTSYYMSSVFSDSAGFFADGIRGHWLIENQLHYVKDANFHEDTSGIKNLVAASNLSILKNVAISIARQNCCKSLKGCNLFCLQYKKIIANHQHLTALRLPEKKRSRPHRIRFRTRNPARACWNAGLRRWDRNRGRSLFCCDGSTHRPIWRLQH